MNVSSVVNHFSTANKGFITTLGSTISAGATTIPLTSVSGLTNGTVFVGLIEPGLANEQEFTGTVDTAGVQITGVKWTDGTNVDHTAGVTIVDYVAATDWNMNTKGLLVAHDQDGTLKAGAVDVTAVLADSVVTNAKILDNTIVAEDKIASDSGWREVTDSWAYASATTITVPTDATTKYSVGDKIRLTQSAAVKYFYVTAVAATVLTVTGGSDYTVANSAISAISYSKAESPLGFPDWFNYTPTWANLTVGNATVTALFSMSGKTVTGTISYIHGTTSSVGASPTFTLPVTASSRYSNTYSLGTVYMEDSGVAGYWGFFRGANTTTVFPAAVGTASTYAGNGGMSSTIPFTWGTGDYMHGTFTYQAA